MVKFGRLVFDDVDDLIISDTELLRSERCEGEKQMPRRRRGFFSLCT